MAYTPNPFRQDEASKSGLFGSRVDPSNLMDGSVGCSEGMNAGVDLLMLRPAQCQKAINLTFRGGVPRSRPSLEEIPIAEIPEYTTFGGAGVYSLDSGDQVIAVLDGKVWAFHLDLGISFCLTDIYSLSHLTLPYGRAWFCQAEHFFIIQDGSGKPIVIQPSGVSHSETVPIGTIMAYGHGRLFVVPAAVGDEDGRRFFMAGDIMWPTQPEKLLNFTETQYLAGGGAMSLPSEMGFITGMAFMRNATTGDGLGGLLVMARGGASLFGVSAPRLQWQEIDISSVLFQTGGTVSPDSIISVNSDLIFRGIDGIRTLMHSAGSSQVLSNVPISGAFGSYLDDTEEDLAYVTCATWDNYVVCTTQREGQFWKALAVFDFAPISIMGQTAPAHAAGFWTVDGLHAVLKARSQGTQVLVWVRGIGGRLGLYRPSHEHQESIPSRFYSSNFSFGSSFYLKRLKDIMVSLSEVSVESRIEAYFRPRGYCRWILAGQMTVPSCNSTGRFINFSIPMTGSYGCDPITGEDIDVSDDFQFAFVVYGNLKIDKFKVRCSFMEHGTRMIEEMQTGDLTTFPGVDLESDDYNHSTGE